MHDFDRANAYLPLLREIPGLSELNDEQGRFIAGGGQLRELSRGQVLCEKGTPNTGLFCLLDGRLKLSAVSVDGGERVLELVLPGRVFGQAAVVLDQPFPCLAQVLNESRVLCLGRERIRQAIVRWPEVAQIMLRCLAQDCFRLLSDLEACCLMTAGERLIRLLLREAEQLPGQADTAALTLPASKALVASSLNLTPETFSRELHDLARQGLLNVQRRTLRIPSLDALRQRLELKGQTLE
jgi:CRP-like cAMP-binding protein